MQHYLDKAQRLKDFKVAPSVHDNMRALGAQLLKGKCLTRLVGKSSPLLCVGKQMIQQQSFSQVQVYTFGLRISEM